MFKVIVAGTRTYNNYQELKQVLDEVLINKKPNIEIVSGGARGADHLGEIYANDNNYQLKIFPADWDIYGKAAGYIRNEQMARYADACVVFWDKQSRGSKHMIDLANKYHLQLFVYYI